MLHSTYDEKVGGPLGSEEIRRLRVPLQLSGVCQQIYTECNHVLWGYADRKFEPPHVAGKLTGFLSSQGLCFEAPYHQNYWLGVLCAPDSNQVRVVASN